MSTGSITNSIITVTQHVGPEEYLIHYVVKDGVCTMERYLISDGKPRLVNTFNVVFDVTGRVVDLILLCVLENNSCDDYRVTISMRHQADMDQIADMTRYLHGLTDIEREDFEKMVETYDKIKESYYQGILCSYTFVGRNYREFFEQSPAMIASVERMVRLLVIPDAGRHGSQNDL